MSSYIFSVAPALVPIFNKIRDLLSFFLVWSKIKEKVKSLGDQLKEKSKALIEKYKPKIIDSINKVKQFIIEEGQKIIIELKGDLINIAVKEIVVQVEKRALTDRKLEI